MNTGMEVASMMTLMNGIGTIIVIVTTVIMFFFTILFQLMTVSFWKLFEQNGYKGWKSLIPLYRLYIICKIAGKGFGLFILQFIPILNIIAYIMLMSGLSKGYGKSGAFTVGLIFLPFIFIPMLALKDDTSYLEPIKKVSEEFNNSTTNNAVDNVIQTSSNLSKEPLVMQKPLAAQDIVNQNNVSNVNKVNQNKEEEKKDIIYDAFQNLKPNENAFDSMFNTNTEENNDMQMEDAS